MSQSPNRPPRNPPSKRLMQVEAFTIVVAMCAALWCAMSGIYLAISLLLTLAR